jgi:hypothetical protein
MDSDLELLDVKWRAIMVEVEKYRRKARTEYMDKRTSEWWCDQVHLARAQERERVIEYLRARGYLSLAAGILAGDHEEEP